MVLLGGRARQISPLAEQLSPTSLGSHDHFLMLLLTACLFRLCSLVTPKDSGNIFTNHFFSCSSQILSHLVFFKFVNYIYYCVFACCAGASMYRSQRELVLSTVCVPGIELR